MFTLTKKECKFLWRPICHVTFVALKKRLVEALILVRPDFNKPFILDVDWLVKGVKTILSKEIGRIVASHCLCKQGFISNTTSFHPMEGKCYVLIWGIMYFRQYLHQTQFLLCIDHGISGESWTMGESMIRQYGVPLEWLTIILDMYSKKEHWITMLEDFQFKIIHHARNQHLNVDALSQNPIDFLEEDEDFGSDLVEREDQLGVTPLPMKSNFANKIIINLFTLQHIDQEINDVEVHHARSECGGQSTNSFSKEILPLMNHMECKRMIVEVQTTIDETRDKQKGKNVETIG